MVATQDYRLNVRQPREGGRGWSKDVGVVDTASCPELGSSWREDIASGAQYLAQETWVPANDPHYDAKCWPVAHPHGSGSFLSEIGSGGLQKYIRNRLSLPDNFFRMSPTW
eukprot:2727597-Karenia_brevis.AAC.1